MDSFVQYVHDIRIFMTCIADYPTMESIMHFIELAHLRKRKMLTHPYKEDNLLWVMRSLRHTYWAEKPDVARTVGGLLAGIVWVDLLAVAVAPQGVGLIFLGLFAAALAAQRWVPAT